MAYTQEKSSKQMQERYIFESKEVEKTGKLHPHSLPWIVPLVSIVWI